MVEMCATLEGVVVSVKLQLICQLASTKTRWIVAEDRVIPKLHQVVASVPPAQMQQWTTVCPTNPSPACSLEQD